MVEKSWDVSFCGLNCSMCDMYLASHGDEKKQIQLVKWFQENIDPKIVRISCEGCRGPEDQCWTSDCQLRRCAQEKNLRYCFECDDLVCEELEKFTKQGIPHHKRTVENMGRMKEIGLENWIEEQEKEVFCP